MASTINASSSGSGGLISTGDASGVLQLQSNGTVALTVNGSGVAFSGTTSSAGNIINTSAANASPYTQARISPYIDGGNWGYLAYGNDALMRIVYASTANGYPLLFGTTSATDNTGTFTETMAMTSGGMLVLKGGLRTAGTGIAFPASQSASSDANTLDDYEEGTWTPTITFGGGTTGQSYTQQKGNYTKIGNRVFVSCYVNLATKGTSTGNAAITGLPFTSVSTSAQYNNVAIWINSTTGLSGSIQAYNGPGTSTVGEMAYVGTGAQTTLTHANFTNGSDIMVNFSYSIAS